MEPNLQSDSEPRHGLGLSGERDALHDGAEVKVQAQSSTNSERHR